MLMLFKEMIAVYSNKHIKHIKYRIQRYRLLKLVGHVFTTSPEVPKNL
jgi:hypothetical protein